jgi:phenylpropionate dioxygenase-like ring-hydroxylating dioxygenase large terminal subunit
LNYLKIEPFEIKSAKTKRAEDFAPQKDLFGDKSITEGIEDVKDYSISGGEESNNNMNDDNKDITYDDLKRKTDELLNFFKQFAKEQDIEIKENNNKSEDDTNFEMFNEDIYSAPEWYQNDKWEFRRTTKEIE